MPRMPAQGSVHDVQRAPHQTLGTRRRCRGRADAARCEPASHACAPRNRRASVWHAKDADGGDALSDEDAAEGGDRDGAARARLQPHAREEHRRYQTTSRGDPGLRSVYRCARRVTVQVAQRGPEVAPGLTPDSVQQKYTQTVVSTRIVPGCVQFLGRKNVFTRPGPKPDARKNCNLLAASKSREANDGISMRRQMPEVPCTTRRAAASAASGSC